MEVETKKCNNCGFENPIEDKFCENCGSELVFHEKIEEQVGDGSSKEKKNSGLGFIGLVIIFLMLFSFYMYFIWPAIKSNIKKPVLYLYPEENMNVVVDFKNEDLLTTTYPKFKDEWSVYVETDGTIYSNGKKYYALYWEEEPSHFVDFSEGFYVTKDNAIEFLEEKLEMIGLNYRESNEFIMYWLPILEKNEKNLIYFELTNEKQSYNELIIEPKPDSLLRLTMHIKKINKKVEVKEQKLPTFERKGFVAVEWGGIQY